MILFEWLREYPVERRQLRRNTPREVESHRRWLPTSERSERCLFDLHSESNGLRQRLDQRLPVSGTEGLQQPLYL